MAKKANNNNTGKGNVQTVKAEKPVKAAGHAVINKPDIQAINKATVNRAWPLAIGKAIEAVKPLPLKADDQKTNCFGHKLISKSAAIDQCLLALANGKLTLEGFVNQLGALITVYGKRYDRKATLKKLSDHSRYYAGNDRYNFTGKLASKGYSPDEQKAICQAMNSLGTAVHEYLK
jgi:hypothetical protein